MGAPQSTNSTHSTQSCHQHGAGAHQGLFIFQENSLTLPVNYGNIFMDVCSMILDPFCMSEMFHKSFLSEHFIHIQGQWGSGHVNHCVFPVCGWEELLTFLFANSQLGQGLLTGRGRDSQHATVSVRIAVGNVKEALFFLV